MGSFMQGRRGRYVWRRPGHKPRVRHDPVRRGMRGRRPGHMWRRPGLRVSWHLARRLWRWRRPGHEWRRPGHLARRLWRWRRPEHDQPRSAHGGLSALRAAPRLRIPEIHPEILTEIRPGIETAPGIHPEILTEIRPGIETAPSTAARGGTSSSCPCSSDDDAFRTMAAAVH